MADITIANITFNGNGNEVPGYLAQPQGAGPFPSLVVIQEWWGLNNHIKDIAERFAREGFVALAPDLYRGKVAEEPDEARKLAMELDREHAVRDIQGAIDFLIAQPFVQPPQAGVLGFCMGGGLSLWMSHMGKHIGASIVFYGGGAPLDEATAAQVSAPILGIYGEKDGGIPLETIRQNEALLQQHGKTAQFHIYPDAPHAFFNDTRESYRPEAAQDAWQKALAWLREHLQA